MSDTTYSWDKRTNKRLMREIAVSRSRRAPYKTALFLPGDKAACVIAAYKAKSIDKSTQLILVDRDMTALIRAHEVVTRLGLRQPIMHADELHTLSLSKVLKRKKLDFAFLDFCGRLSANLCCWLYATQDQMNKAKIAATFTATFIGNNTDPFDMYAMEAANEELPRGVASELAGAETNWFRSLLLHTPMWHHMALAYTCFRGATNRLSFSLSHSMCYADSTLNMQFFVGEAQPGTSDAGHVFTQAYAAWCKRAKHHDGSRRRLGRVK